MRDENNFIFSEKLLRHYVVSLRLLRALVVKCTRSYSICGKISLKKIPPTTVLKWFNIQKPLSGYGKIKLGEAHILTGNREKGSLLIKEGWRTAKLSKNELKYLRKKYYCLILKKK